MKKQVPLTAVLAAALLLVAVVGYLALIKPKRDEGARLDEQIAELETKVAVASRPARSTPTVEEIDSADLFRLAKAMPQGDDMPGILLELDVLAASTGLRFNEIQPQAPVAGQGYYTLPINLKFAGMYYDLSDFLFRLRNLVTVRDGALAATGRLYRVDAIDMQEDPEERFPHINAAITVSAYVFGPPPTAPASGGTSGTTSTSGASASAATGGGSGQAPGGNG